MAIEPVPLCEVTATLAPLDLPGTPAGHRVVLQVSWTAAWRGSASMPRRFQPAQTGS
jgi:hypothetical protein